MVIMTNKFKSSQDFANLRKKSLYIKATTFIKSKIWILFKLILLYNKYMHDMHANQNTVLLIWTITSCSTCLLCV